MQTPLSDWHVADSVALWWEVETFSIALCVFQSHGVAPCSLFVFMWYFFYFLPCVHAVNINSLNTYLIFLNFDHKLNYIWNIPVFCEVYKGVSLFHRAFQFTMCNGQTNALVCNKTLIQMSHIKTLKITPTCFDHQLIIRELFDPS
jgi:hypothetical protein